MTPQTDYSTDWPAESAQRPADPATGPDRRDGQPPLPIPRPRHPPRVAGAGTEADDAMNKRRWVEGAVALTVAGILAGGAASIVHADSSRSHPTARTVPVSPRQHPPPRETVVVYGDSLTVESEASVDQIYRRAYARIVFRAYPGTALCDWTAQAVRDEAALHPQRVVLAFTGNTATCVAADFRAAGVTGAVANYRSALERMRAIYRTQAITVTLAPAMRNLPSGWFPFNGNPALNAMYRTVGAQLRMTVNSDADDALTPHHVFTGTRPGPDGTSVVVRQSDGVHLTPAGAATYGRALLGPVTSTRPPY